MSYRWFINRYVPDWMIVSIDTLTILLAFFLTCLLMNDFRMNTLVQADMLLQIPILLTAHWTGFAIFKPYKAVTGCTGIRDIEVIFYSVFTGAVLIIISNLLLNQFLSDKLRPLTFSILLTDIAVTLYIMIITRLIIRYLYKMVSKEAPNKLPVPQNQLRVNSIRNYPAELIVFNALN